MRLSVVHRFILIVFPHLHHKSREAIAEFVFGALFASTAGVASIGRELARRLGKVPKHAIKQFDRFLSSAAWGMPDVLPAWARAVAGASGRLLVALDWTEFAHDGHHILVASRVHRNGRAIPMMWRTVPSGQLEGRMKQVEREVLAELRRAVPAGRKIVVLADRGFGDVAFYQWLREQRLDFVIRFRRCIYIDAGEGMRRAALLVPPNGKARFLPCTDIGKRGEGAAHVVLVKARGMKEPWCLATSLELHADEIVRLYGRRFTTEETFRDIKDRRFGMGLSATRMKRTDRRDRMLLVLTLTIFIATTVGRASEQLGLDRSLRANTVRVRTHSLFKQGRHYLAVLANANGPLDPRYQELAHRVRRIHPSDLAYAA